MAGSICWAVDAAEQLEQMGPTEREIFDMYTSGPMASEYGHDDVWRALNAIGIEVGYESVKRHRNGYCRCRKANR